MRAVVQRVKSAGVHIGGAAAARIGRGLLVFLGVEENDAQKDAEYIAEKIANLRIFEDGAGKMNLSAKEAGGEILVVSQFTLYGDCRKGRRPSFVRAARPEKAGPLYERTVSALRAGGLTVQTGRFQAMMDVSLVNDGPVTLILDSSKDF